MQRMCFLNAEMVSGTFLLIKLGCIEKYAKVGACVRQEGHLHHEANI